MQLGAEQKRAVEEGLGVDELAVFDLVKKENLFAVTRSNRNSAMRSLMEWAI